MSGIYPLKSEKNDSAIIPVSFTVTLLYQLFM